MLQFHVDPYLTYLPFVARPRKCYESEIYFRRMNFQGRYLRNLGLPRPKV